LSPANSLATKQRLLKQLRLPAFLPLVAVTTLEAAREHHLDVDAAPPGITPLQSTPELERLYPATVHADGLMATRIVSRDSDAQLHRLLSAYRKQTGLTTLLMADLALGNDPVASLPRDAMRIFEAASLDYLALSNFLVQGLHVSQRAAAVTA
jgi:carbamoyltransferase